jgi:DNA-binding response OmpR family regulator
VTDLTAGADPRIVLIEDDIAIADMYRLQLELAGHTVWIAADGETGLRLARERLPDVVFLDLRLPKLDGFEVLAALRDDPRTTGLPVVVLSNYGAPEMMSRALDLGAKDYLIKTSVTPVELSSRLASWIAA